jgi:uncharacterized membrane protein YjfL (UPF0719 family)
MPTETSTDQPYVLPAWEAWGLAGLKILLFVALLAALWELINALTRVDDEEELFTRRNVPYAVVRVSLVAAQAIAMMPLLGYTTGAFWTELGTLAAWGAGILVVLLGLGAVGNRVLGVGPSPSASSGPAALPAAVVQGGFLIAAGLVFHAALSGTAPSIGTAIASSLVFSLLGIIALLVAHVVLTAVGPFGRRLRPRGANLASAVMTAGVLIGLGLILRASIAGDFMGWGSGLAGFAVTFLAGLIGLVVLVWLIDLLIIRSRHMRDIVGRDEVLPAVVMGSMVVAVSLGVSAVQF